MTDMTTKMAAQLAVINTGVGTKATFQEGDSVIVNSESKGFVDKPGVVVTVHKNQYMVVKFEGAGAAVTVKKSECTLRKDKPTEGVVIPRKPTTYPSKKQFHLVYDDGIEGLRKVTRIPFDSNVHMAYNPDKMFHPRWETSNFFDMLPGITTYGELSLFASDEQKLLRAVNFFESVARDGLRNKDIPNGKIHRIIYGDWDGQGMSIVVPIDSQYTKLEDLGIHLVMKNPTDRLKVRKYFRRIKAHHEWAIMGKVEGRPVAAKAGKVLKIRIEDERQPFAFNVLHVDINSMSDDNKAVADGVHFISLGLCRILGLKFGIAKLANATVGDAFKGTMFSKLGLGKGFFHVVDMERYQIIIYGPKTQVSFDEFFLGSLGDVKGGEAFTDIQSLGAFISTGSSLWLTQARLFISELVESARDENRLRHLFLSTAPKIFDLKENDERRKAWILEEALRHGVPILHNPGLFRRVVRHLLTQVLDCERGRIPYGTSAHRYNLMPDLACFNWETGEVDYTQTSIPENAVCCIDANAGPFAMYRQPLGNPLEAVVTTNFHSRRFRNLKGRERIVLGLSVRKYLQQMGGGDFDDSVVGTDHTDWIEAIDQATYPLSKLELADRDVNELAKSDNRFIKQRQYPSRWSIKEDFFEATAKATEQQLTIGPIDNAIRLDMLLSGEHKANELRYLADRIAKTEDKDLQTKLMRSYLWLENRTDHQLRDVASNLEAFIDFIKLGKGNPVVLGPMIDKLSDVRDNSLVYPECWTYLGRGGRGRIPAAKRVSADFVLAPSLVCDTLNTLIKERDVLLEGFKVDEWKMVQRIPQSLNAAFPRGDVFRDMATALRGMWRDGWKPVMEGQVDPSFGRNEKEITSKSYKALMIGGNIPLKGGTKLEVTGISQQLNEWDPIHKDWDSGMRMQIAVEIARQTYRTRYSDAPVGSDGKYRSYSDGLLWTNEIGLFYIEALKEAGLTGMYMPVSFDRQSRQYANLNMNVRTYKGDVIRVSDGFQLGHVIGDVPDGEYSLSYGMLCVVEPAYELTASATEVNESFDNPQEFVSDEEPSNF